MLMLQKRALPVLAGHTYAFLMDERIPPPMDGYIQVGA
jgi:hypothetical protein